MKASRKMRTLIVTVFVAANSSLFSQLSFTINSASGIFSITCTNSVVTLNASTNYSSSPVSYNWTSPQLTSVVGASFAASNPGVYTITATAGTISASQMLTIGINTIAPSVSLTANPTGITCFNPTVQLLGASSNTNASYLWGTNGIQPPCLYNSCIAAVAGVYTLDVVSLVNGCKASATINVVDNRIYPNISAPGVTTISCPNGTAYLGPTIAGNASVLAFAWTGPSGPIMSGSNSASVIVNSPGIYTVIATNTINGCATLAQLSVFACVGLTENIKSTTSIKISPNPFCDKIRIQVDADYFNSYRVSIYNLFGVLISTNTLSEKIEELDLSNLKSGLYLIKVDDGKQVLKVLKE